MASTCVSSIAIAQLSCNKGPENRVQYPKGRYVDVHVHMGGGKDVNGESFTFQSLLEWMDSNGVAQAMVLSAIRVPEERHSDELSNSELMIEFEKQRPRLYPFCVIHPNVEKSPNELVEMLRQFQKQGVKGFGELKPGNNLTIDDAKCMRLYEACSQVGLPVLFHMDDAHCVDNPGLSRLRKVLESFPDCIFIAHGPGWWASISGSVKTQEEMRGYPYPPGKISPGGAVDQLLEQFANLYGDLSAGSGLNAIKRDPEFGRDFLIRRADKLLFGTDTFKLTQNWGHFEFFNRIELPVKVRAKIFRDNTRRLLKL